MISTLLASFKTLGGTAKLLVIAGILATVLGAMWTTYNKIWTSGYNKAQLDFQNDSIRLADAAVAKAQKQWKASAAAAEAQLLVEERIERSLRDVEKEIPAVVDTVAAECRDLGDDVLRMYNDAISAANNAAKGRPNTP